MHQEPEFADDVVLASYEVVVGLFAFRIEAMEVDDLTKMRPVVPMAEYLRIKSIKNKRLRRKWVTTKLETFKKLNLLLR